VSACAATCADRAPPGNRFRLSARKTHPSYQDVITKRRALIAAEYRADLDCDPSPGQIHTIRLTWAHAAA
jgi:hypothetical protein